MKTLAKKRAIVGESDFNFEGPSERVSEQFCFTQTLAILKLQ